MRLYEVRDPIYGFITFNELEKSIINRFEFQRLRRIKQLALTDMVYPGATHTRFEHSLGVMYLATLMFDAIVKKEENRKILAESVMQYEGTGIERERQVIRLASLLHDIGHGPFSHTSDELFPINDKQPNKHFKHEEYSCEIIEKCLKDTIEKHPSNMSNYGIQTEEICDLIGGKGNCIGKRIFWKILISSQLDADRCDYLIRDSYHAGVKYGVFDHSRLINTMQLSHDPETNDPVVAIHEDGWHTAESIVLARYKMFTQVYFHKTRRAYDYHLKEAMKCALKGNTLPTPQKINDYLYYDDVTMWNLFNENHTDNNCKSILNRDHLRSVYFTPETPKPEDEAKKEEMKKRLEKHGIWYYEDSATKVWYDKEKSDERIWIVSKHDNKTSPLDEYSKIVENMMENKQIRLYVNHTDKEKALEVLK